MVPLRTPSAKASMRARSAMTVFSISAPPIAAPGGWRSATCSTARSSVVLMCSPRHMASMRARSPTASASCNSFAERHLIQALAREIHQQPRLLAREALEAPRVAFEQFCTGTAARRAAWA